MRWLAAMGASDVLVGPTAYYLASGGHANGAGDGRLSATEPTTVEPPDAFVYNPRRAVTGHHGLRTPSRLVLPVVPAEGPR